MNAMPGLSRALGDLAKLTRMGQSFSGRERNCSYLNVGGTDKPFANVSAISGFNFPDDARAVALVDWDQDGRLDAWLTNRTAPRVRLLRNEDPSNNHFLALRLEGRTCNRDAIGARVEVVIGPASIGGDDSSGESQTLVKTLHAGGGFVSQSSKWLHFGLGESGQVREIVVHWPGGEPETFSDTEFGSWVRLVQGTGNVTVWEPPKRDFQLTASAAEIPEATGKGRTVLVVPPPLPQMSYTTLDGTPAVLGESREHPRLVTLWQSDCQACLAELKEFGVERQRLRDAGLDVVAICVDGVSTGQDVGDADNGVDATGARSILERLGFPFDAGMGTAELIDKFFLTIDQFYIRDIPPSVPTTMLLDSRGRIAVIYRGKIGVDQVLADMRILPLTDLAKRDAAVPLPGRWILPTYREDSHMSRLASALAGHGYEDASIEYLESNLKTAKDDPRYATMLIGTGKALLAKKDFAAAEANFREAASVAPEDLDAKKGLAAALAYQRRHADAIPIYRSLIAAQPDDIETLVSLGVSLQFVIQPDEAIEYYRRALKIDPEHGRANLYLAKFQRYTGRVEASIPHFRKALASDPESSEVHFELGMALLQQSDVESARKHFRKMGRDTNQFVSRMNLLAWRHATQADSKDAEKRQAVVLGQMVVELTANKHPTMLDTLAVAYAANDRFADAVATEEKALAIAEANAKAKHLVPDFRQRLELFRESKPYRPPAKSN